MMKAVVVTLALCVAVCMSASTQGVPKEAVRELLDGLMAERREARLEKERGYMAKANAQLKTLVAKMYELEDSEEKRERQCGTALGGSCTSSAQCNPCPGEDNQAGVRHSCQRALEFGAQGTCVTCLAAASRCGANTKYGTDCCNTAQKSLVCAPYHMGIFTGCTDAP